MSKNMMFAPSLMCMDLLHVESTLADLDERCDFYHVDIMDGTYVQNFALSPDFVRTIKPHTTKPIDVHLMMTRPQNYIETFAKAGADYISPHCDTITRDAFRILNQIKTLGCKTGIVLNPADPLETVLPYIKRLDKVTLLTVDPGFAGQTFIPEMLDKVRAFVQLREKYSLDYLIEIDGSCNKGTFKELTKAGADILIVGNSGLFDLADNVPDAWDIMMQQYHEATK